MMRLPAQSVLQDSVPVKIKPVQDTASLRSDTASVTAAITSKDSIPHKPRSVQTKAPFETTDTISVCTRNSIGDVTFYDSLNLVTKIEPAIYDRFPVLFTEKNRQIEDAAKATLVKQLKRGSDLPIIPLHDDWLILVILVTVILFSLIRTSAKSLIPAITRFFLFRGIKDSSAKEYSGLFNWDSTIKNLISYSVLGLFGYAAASYNQMIPASLGSLTFWLISVAIIITAVSIRHIVCLITGMTSGEKEAFREYILGVYQFYRFSALIIFVILILMFYTTIIPVKSCFTAGIIALALLYLIRIMRLFIIFINKNISLFYLILYLCALEILPVVISVKYFSGLV